MDDLGEPPDLGNLHFLSHCNQITIAWGSFGSFQIEPPASSNRQDHHLFTALRSERRSPGRGRGHPPSAPPRPGPPQVSGASGGTRSSPGTRGAKSKVSLGRKFHLKSASKPEKKSNFNPQVPKSGGSLIMFGDVRGVILIQGL